MVRLGPPRQRGQSAGAVLAQELEQLVIALATEPKLAGRARGAQAATLPGKEHSKAAANGIIGGDRKGAPRPDELVIVVGEGDTHGKPE